MADGNNPFFGWDWIDTCKMVPCSQLAAQGEVLRSSHMSLAVETPMVFQRLRRGLCGPQVIDVSNGEPPSSKTVCPWP